MKTPLVSPLQANPAQGFNRPPADYPRRVLLAVCGLSPQIVTETIYALAANEHAPFIPTEVHLITTAEGARRAELSLLSDDLGWFHKLCTDYALPGISFNRHHIHVMRDAQERAMDDIRSPQDNLDAANFITAQVRQFSADPNCALHVSIAGGRKTMGFYLGYALSLYGRAQDRLSHVLVSDPFESSWDFFYPTPYSRVLQTKDDKLADTAMQEDIQNPFVCRLHLIGDHRLRCDYVTQTSRQSRRTQCCTVQESATAETVFGRSAGVMTFHESPRSS